MKNKRNKQAYRLAIKHYWQQLVIERKLSFTGLLLTGLGSILVFYMPPLIIARFIQKFANEGGLQLSEAMPYILALGGLWLAGEMIWRLAIHLMIKTETRSVKRLHENAVDYLLEKELAFFHDNFAGSLTKKTIGYANQFITFADTLLFSVSPYLIPTIFASFVLWQFSPWLVIVLLGMVAIVLAIITPMIEKRRQLVVLRETASNKVSGLVSDIYSNIDAVRSFSNEDVEARNHKKQVLDLAKKAKSSWDYQNKRIEMIISPFYVAINVLGLIIALAVSQNTDQGIEAVFITFAFYANTTRFLWEFNSVYKRLETAFSDAAQFTELLLDEPKVQDIKNPITISIDKGEIEFRDVCFDHEDETDDLALFNKLSLNIKPGEKVGLVGHSGGGKTTLTKLVMRLMDIDGGEILIDGQNIALAKQATLRKHLSYVPQDPIMFHRSLAENISYGKQNATQAEIEKAAKMAHAHEFIEKLPKGYETLVGERGIKLSGGQRQRVAIARAMLKDAPILLLDEATSALDSESEKLIQDALWKLMKDKTTIVIAHRLSTIQKMDRILVLENGEVVEEGSHQKLLTSDGIYSELWKHQSGGFIEE